MDWKHRSHCGKLTEENLQKDVILYGWIDTIRDHGQLIFMHLRDRSGEVQLVFDKENPTLFKAAESIRPEFVVEVSGKIAERSDETKNLQMPTGKIEVVVIDCKILSKSETPPFMITEKTSRANEGSESEAPEGLNVDEDIRLKYRYLDLRRQSMQRNLIKRSQFIKIIRDYLDKFQFTDIETPVLTKSTPEGARDYLVPSRLHEGKCYALPQSPQLFKQLLMISGFERYYQVVKCFRDEDLRPNRQPEFTQLDIEASFIDEEFIYDLIEGLIVKLFDHEGVTLEAPFPRITYAESMDKYGNDHPDLRFGYEMINVTHLLGDVNFKVFNAIVKSGGMIKAINLKGQADKLSKNMLQEDLAKKVIPKLGGKGLAWMKMEEGKLNSNIVQFFSEDEQASLVDAMSAENGDVLIFIADTSHALVNDVLGRFRCYIAERLGIIDQTLFVPCWVVDFPMFEWKDGRASSLHHPFTQPSGPIPSQSDRESILAMQSRAYDIVINGEEVGGGSIRIHDTDMQEKVFGLLGLSTEEIREKFGFFVDALKYGAPPHGGIALGLDRLTAMILRLSSIREVIAFPKNRVASCPLTQAPSTVDNDQLSELHLKAVQKTPSEVSV